MARRSSQLLLYGTFDIELCHDRMKGSLTVSCCMLLIFSGCSPTKSPPPPPPPRGVTVHRPISFPESPVLQRLADAGAWITLNMPGKGPCEPTVGSTAILFKDQLVNNELLIDVAQLDRKVFLRFGQVRFMAHALDPLDGAEQLYGLSIEDPDDRILADIHFAPALRELFVGGPKVTARGLRFLSTAQELCHLDLTDADVGDDGLGDVATRERLVRLGLNGTRVTDDGLARLRALDKLVELKISRCPVTDRGIAHLTALHQLQTLELSKTAVTDRALSDIARLKHLEYLSLDGTRITDDGLSYLTSLENLVVLVVSDTKVTDVGIAHLQRLPKLASVIAFNTQITEKGKHVLPQVEYSLNGSARSRSK